MSDVEPEASAGVHFYNMTSELVTMELNTTPRETIGGMSPSHPHSWNHNEQQRYTRVAKDPQNNQLGNVNTLTYTSDDGQVISMKVTISVDCDFYDIAQTVLVYMFRDSVVVVSKTNNKSYIGRDKETIEIAAKKPPTP